MISLSSSQGFQRLVLCPAATHLREPYHTFLIFVIIILEGTDSPDGSFPPVTTEYYLLFRLISQTLLQ